MNMSGCAVTHGTRDFVHTKKNVQTRPSYTHNLTREMDMSGRAMTHVKRDLIHTKNTYKRNLHVHTYLTREMDMSGRAVTCTHFDVLILLLVHDSLVSPVKRFDT